MAESTIDQLAEIEQVDDGAKIWVRDNTASPKNRGWKMGGANVLPGQHKSPTIIVKDTLRASVEAASGGRVTVLYDDLGLPSYMVRIPAFNVEDIHSDYGSGRHPAFVVNGSKKPEIFIGMHQAHVYQNRALSLPGLDPTTSIDYDTAALRCSAKGSGWHLMTNWEWAAVALWVLKQTEDGILTGQPRGNTNYGRSHEEYQETGTRQDGGTYNPGEAAGSARILTGSGPAMWRHDLSSFGISDLVGNIWEWVGGLKTDGGRIYMPVDNHWDLAESSWPATSVYVAKDGSTPKLSDAQIEISETYIYDWWRSLIMTAGYDALPLATREQMMQALIAPRLTDVATDPFAAHAEGRFYIRTADERMPLRGGRWGNGSLAGLGALILNNLRSNSSTYIGFRPAFVAP